LDTIFHILYRFEVFAMGFGNLRQFLKKIGERFLKRSLNPNTVLDTVSLKLWGLSIQVTRELRPDIPYELTVVIPRVELRKQPGTVPGRSGLEINLNSITIAHSPRFEGTEPGRRQLPDPALTRPRPDPPNTQ